jgi:hypothetical protein
VKAFFSYWLWPNPAGWQYADGKVQILLVACIVAVILSFFFVVIRSRFLDARARTLSSSWSSALFWFGVVGLVLTVSRVEMIQFLSMRLLWAFFALSLALYILIQMMQFRRRYYSVVQQAHVIDERDKYLPRQKRT